MEFVKRHFSELIRKLLTNALVFFRIWFEEEASVRLSGSLVTDELWGYGRVPEFLKLCDYERSGSNDGSFRLRLKVRPIDDTFVRAADLTVVVEVAAWAEVLLALESCEALRTLGVRSGPDTRLSTCVKWEVDVRPVTVADQMELLLVVDDLDDLKGVL